MLCSVGVELLVFPGPRTRGGRRGSNVRIRINPFFVADYFTNLFYPLVIYFVEIR